MGIYPMFCKKYANWGILYLYNELEAKEKQIFEAHFHKCSNCQEELKILQDSKEMYQLLPQEDISPVSLNEVLQIEPTRRFNIKHLLNRFTHFFQSITLPKKRLVLAPIGIILLIVLMFNLGKFFHTSNTLEFLGDEKYVLEWNSGLIDSLKIIDERLADFKIDAGLIQETIITDEETDESLWDNFVNNKLSQIDEEIQLLSNELGALNF